MRPFTRDDLRALLGTHDAPCVSILVPTTRGPQSATENALRYKNALKDAEAALAPYPKDLVRAVLDRLNRFDASFFGDQRAALAVFATSEKLEFFRLGETTAAATVVGDSFLTKPLVKYLQGELRYYLLTVAKENVSLWEGGRDALDPVVVPGMPRGLRDMEEVRGREQGVAARNVGTGTVYYGAGGAEADPKQELRSLFRAVDRALHGYTHDEKTPLVLATFEHYHAIFHEVSKNPALLDEGITGDPESFTRDQLREKALDLLRPQRQAALKELADEYGAALHAKRATNYLPNIATAAVHGRVKTLLVEDGRTMPGVVDRATGDVVKTSATTTDLLDDVGELVLAAGGNVYVLPKNLMPTDVGIAAIYRY